MLSNVRDMVERWLARAHARLRGLPVSPGGDGRRPGQRTRAYRPSAAEAAAGADSRARRLAAYEDVRRRHLAGETLLAIGRATGLARATVRKYAHAEGFPERAVRRPGRSDLDPYLAHLETRLAQGCEDAMVLWREARAQGYPGGRQMVQRWVAERRTKPAPRTARKWLREAPAGAPSGAAPDEAAALPSPKQLAWLLVQPTAALQPSDAAAVKRVEQDEEAPWSRPSRGGSPPSSGDAASGNRRAPPRPRPTWTPGWPRPARAASAASRPSPPGWSRTAPRCAPP